MLELLANPPLTRRRVSLADLNPHADAPGAAPQHWLQCMLDEVDYGMLLLTDERFLSHANKAARRDLNASHPLQLLGQELRARLAQDVAPLHQALHDAAHAGRRRLMRLGDESTRCTVAVIPLPLGSDGTRPVLLLLGRHQVCEELSVENFARAHHLTMAETSVLKALCSGLSPIKVAQRQGVALSTVRTQIGSIRAKTGAQSIRTLLAQVAQLPPMVNALGAAPFEALAA